MRIWCVWLVCLSLTLSANEARAKKSAFDLPAFDLHTFPNGLRLITIENRAHPIIGLTAYVTTGGRTESAHFAGALHYIEHLVFKGGTKNYAPTHFRKRIAALGDENGGWTWDDEIQFGFEVPKKNFDESLELFTESLLELQWSKKWFEDERKVVLQEIEKVSERPWHRLWNAWDQLAFEKHPYRRAVIGTADTVRGQTMQELERYYRERFTPNHLILIVVGDFERRAMIARIRKRFARYKRGPASFALKNIGERRQVAPRRTRFAYKGTRNAKLLLGFRTPGAAHEDTPALMLLGKLLSSNTEGIPAWLIHRKQWVTSVAASHNFMVDHGTLTVEAEMAPENVDTVIRWLRGWISDRAARPFSADAVNEAARLLLAERARGWETFGEQAQGVGFWVERMGQDATRKSTARILRQTPESLVRIGKKYLRAERQVEALMVPAAKPGSGRAKQVEAPEPSPPVPDLMRAGLLTASKQPSWRWKRSGESGGRIRYRLSSGLTLLVEPRPGSGLVDAVAWVRGGQWVEPPELAGIGVLTTRLLKSGTRNLSRAEWDRVLGARAISYAIEPTFDERSAVWRNVFARDGATVSLGATADQWRPTVALLGEALLRPRFPVAQVRKAKTVLLSEIDALRENNLEYIKQEFYRLAFPDHPYGRATIGDKRTVSGLSRTLVATYHEQEWTPDRMVVSVVGDVRPDDVASFIASHWPTAGMRRAGALPKATAPTPRPEKERARAIDLGKAQRCINFGFPTLTANDPRFPALEVLLSVARGRHFYKYVYDRGVSYRSWIKLWPHRSPSAWILENDVARKTYDETLAEIEADLKGYARGTFSAEDVRLSAQRLLNRAVLAAQGGQRTAFETARSIGIGQPFGFQESRLETLRTLTAKAVNRLAKEVFGKQGLYRLQLR